MQVWAAAQSLPQNTDVQQVNDAWGNTWSPGDNNQHP